MGSLLRRHEVGGTEGMKTSGTDKRTRERGERVAGSKVAERWSLIGWNSKSESGNGEKGWLAGRWIAETWSFIGWSG